MIYTIKKYVKFIVKLWLVNFKYDIYDNDYWEKANEDLKRKENEA